MKTNFFVSIVLSAVVLSMMAGSSALSASKSDSKKIIRQLTTQEQIWRKEADKRWPSDVLNGYRKAQKLYESGHTEKAFQLVSQLAKKPLRLAPESVLRDPKIYNNLYTYGRQLPTGPLFRSIRRCNELYASQLAKSGDTKKALAVLSVNLDLSRQAINTEPGEINCLINGISMWKQTWGAAKKLYQASGNQKGTYFAQKQIENNDKFLKQQVVPFVGKELGKSNKLSNHYEKKNLAKYNEVMHQLRMAEIPKERELILLWKKTVDSGVQIPVK